MFNCHNLGSVTKFDRMWLVRIELKIVIDYTLVFEAKIFCFETAGQIDFD
jgi:hypothetical protein